MSHQLVGDAAVAVLLEDGELGHVPCRVGSEVVGQVALLLHVRQELLNGLRRFVERNRAAEADDFAPVLREDDASMLEMLIPDGARLIDGVLLEVWGTGEGFPKHLDEPVDVVRTVEVRGSVVDPGVVDRQPTTSISLVRMTASSVISAEIV